MLTTVRKSYVGFVSLNVAEQLNNLFNPIVKVNGIGHPFGGVFVLSSPLEPREKEETTVGFFCSSANADVTRTKAFPRPLAKGEPGQAVCGFTQV